MSEPACLESFTFQPTQVSELKVNYLLSTHETISEALSSFLSTVGMYGCISCHSTGGCAYSSNSESIINDGASVLLSICISSRHHPQIGCKCVHFSWHSSTK